MARHLKVSNALFALESPCDGRTFILDYSYPAYNRKVKQQIVDMAVNGSEVRADARVLHVSPSTVIRELKKNLRYS